MPHLLPLSITVTPIIPPIHYLHPMKLPILSLWALGACTACQQSIGHFTGTVQYAYTYESNELNLDSLTAQKPRMSIFRFDTLNYQSQFIGKDTVTYYYYSPLNKAVSQTGSLHGLECEDYGVATDSVLWVKVYDTEEKIWGQTCKVIEFQTKLCWNRYHVSTNLHIAPATYQKHLAYNWQFYGQQTQGGLILQLEHRFKRYTMKGVATALTPQPQGFVALTLGDSAIQKACGQ
jgi:hypothetical protein